MQRAPASFWFFQRGAGVPGDRIEQERASMRRHPRARGLERNVFFMAVFGERASALEKINLETNSPKRSRRLALGDEARVQRVAGGARARKNKQPEAQPETRAGR
jgi:hypothetical protein